MRPPWMLSYPQLTHIKEVCPAMQLLMRARDLRRVGVGGPGPVFGVRAGGLRHSGRAKLLKIHNNDSLGSAGRGFCYTSRSAQE